jgi:hypothetical protein
MFITTDNSDRITTGHVGRKPQTIARRRRHCLRISHSILRKMNCHKSKISRCRTKATPIVGIPKHGRLAIIRAYRPITLLNSDSNIFARIVAKRPFTQVQVVLHHASSVCVQPYHHRCCGHNTEPYCKYRTDASTSLHHTSELPGGLRQCITRLPWLHPRKVQEGYHSLNFTSFLLP